MLKHNSYFHRIWFVHSYWYTVAVSAPRRYTMMWSNSGRGCEVWSVQLQYVFQRVEEKTSSSSSSSSSSECMFYKGWPQVQNNRRGLPILHVLRFGWAKLDFLDPFARINLLRDRRQFFTRHDILHLGWSTSGQAAKNWNSTLTTV